MITEETKYPSAYVLTDPGVKDSLAANPEARADLEAFADSIHGARFEASRPLTSERGT